MTRLTQAEHQLKASQTKLIEKVLKVQSKIYEKVLLPVVCISNCCSGYLHEKQCQTKCKSILSLYTMD